MLATLRRQSSHIKQTPPDKTAKQFRGQIDGPATGANRTTLEHCMQPEPCQQGSWLTTSLRNCSLPMACVTDVGLVLYRVLIHSYMFQRKDCPLFGSKKCSNLIDDGQFLSARNVVNCQTHPQSKLIEILSSVKSPLIFNWTRYKRKKVLQNVQFICCKVIKPIRFSVQRKYQIPNTIFTFQIRDYAKTGIKREKSLFLMFLKNLSQINWHKYAGRKFSVYKMFIKL